jgi:hypothetical protein
MKNPPNDINSHMRGTKRGEQWAFEGRREPGREGEGRTSRDATGINADKRKPIDPRMPHLPPA